ncbi:hypothetical protein [Rhodococcoides corynebacterioides]|uniref:hypothetical protein n=1 Tax=Rhodococcoides corynebacterioides TaxID=53972 RepID=UPI0008328185|nr:hypothetical protein [Rhodococcus corynebacterioides]
MVPEEGPNPTVGFDGGHGIDQLASRGCAGGQLRREGLDMDAESEDVRAGRERAEVTTVLVGVEEVYPEVEVEERESFDEPCMSRPAVPAVGDSMIGGGVLKQVSVDGDVAAVPGFDECGEGDGVRWVVGRTVVGVRARRHSFDVSSA